MRILYHKSGENGTLFTKNLQFAQFGLHCLVQHSNVVKRYHDKLNIICHIFDVSVYTGTAGVCTPAVQLSTKSELIRHDPSNVRRPD